MINKRFKLKQSDGEICSQVLVYNEDDLEYWADQAKKTGHLIAFDYHVPENAMGYTDLARDIYQIFPPEQAHKIHLKLSNKQVRPAMLIKIYEILLELALPGLSTQLKKSPRAFEAAFDYWLIIPYQANPANG